MVLNISEEREMAWGTVKESLSTQTIVTMMVIGRITKCMEKECYTIQRTK